MLSSVGASMIKKLSLPEQMWEGGFCSAVAEDLRGNAVASIAMLRGARASSRRVAPTRLTGLEQNGALSCQLWSWH